MTFDVHFDGFFQCRLATDPDPYDEPMGVSGRCFAQADEPPLDRIVRFQDPVRPRRHGPPVGVMVRHVLLDEADLPDCPLIDAPVELLDEPRFEGHNGLIADDAFEPIVPFALRIGGRGLRLERGAAPDGATWRSNPDPELVRHHFGDGGDGRPDAVLEVADAIGLGNHQRWRACRVGDLEQDVAEAVDAAQRAIRAARLTRFRRLARENRDLLLIRANYEFPLDAPGAAVEDPAGILGVSLDPLAPWPLSFWMGGWDYDTMCGFVRGRLQIPVS
jgi:hypothetical protein